MKKRLIILGIILVAIIMIIVVFAIVNNPSDQVRVEEESLELEYDEVSGEIYSGKLEIESETDDFYLFNQEKGEISEFVIEKNSISPTADIDIPKFIKEDVVDFSVSEDGAHVVLKIVDEENGVSMYVYNVQKDTSEKLPKGSFQALWLNNSEMIISLYDEIEERGYLKLYNIDGSIKNLIDLNSLSADDVSGELIGVSENGEWLVFDTIGGGEEPVALYYIYNLSTQEIKILADSGKFSDARLFGNSIVLQSFNNLILVIDLENDIRYETVLDLDLGKSIYYPDENKMYYARIVNSQDGKTDSFWEYDFKTDSFTRLTKENLPGNIDITEMFASPDYSKIYFRNRGDNKMYSINLK